MVVRSSRAFALGIHTPDSFRARACVAGGSARLSRSTVCDYRAHVADGLDVVEDHEDFPGISERLLSAHNLKPHGRKRADRPPAFLLRNCKRLKVSPRRLLVGSDLCLTLQLIRSKYDPAKAEKTSASAAT